MSERPVTLFVPPDIHPPAPANAIPIPPLQKAPFTSPLLLGLAAINRSGRLSEQRLVSALGWAPGDRLATEATHDMIIIRRSADGPFTLDSRGQVFLPHGLQTLFSITTGDRVVLVAVPQHDMLIIHTISTIAGLIATYYDNVLPVITQSDG
jgi:bifunctional DNA-binding transcriptional regulator/antitoxin component of YhaV-PrlF toxin-antitoxin module